MNVALAAAVVCMPAVRAAGRPRLDAAGRRALDQALRSRVHSGDIPAAVAIVVSRDDVLYLDAFGKRDGAAGAPATPDVIFRLASMTKPITSLAVMMLVEDGRVELDDPIATYLPGFTQPAVVTAVHENGAFESRPALRAVTIRDLLTHTSGIAYPFFDPTLTSLFAKGVPDAEMPLIADPGVRFAYGPSTAILGRMVAAASGGTLDDFCRRRVFEPLGMVDTGYTVPSVHAGRVVTRWQRDANGAPIERPNPAVHASRGRGDDGLFSTARDYGAFMQLFLNRGRHGRKRIVGARTIETMTTNQIGTLVLRLIESPDRLLARGFPKGAGKDKFGFGFQIQTPPSPGMRSPGSLSWAGIFNTHFWIDPTRGIAAAVMMQLLPSNDPKVVELLDDFERSLYRHLP